MDAWLLWMQDTAPGMAGDQPGRWWSGHGELTFEGQTWIGAKVNPAQDDRAAIVGITTVEQTIDLPGKRTTIQMAVTPAAQQVLMGVDFGTIEVEIGWIARENDWDAWERIPRRRRGLLSDASISDGIWTGVVETLLGDVERRRNIVLSGPTQRALYPTDAAYDQASELAADRDFRWPPSI